MIIRETKSVCPACLSRIKASVMEDEGKVYLEKTCAVHGRFKLLLSNHPDYFRQLNDFYFALMDKGLKQRDYIVHLTNRCDLNCPICLAEANSRQTDDYPLENLEEFLKGKKGYKIDLMGAEPLTRQDLPRIIRAVNKSGNIAALHTNGVKIADYQYLKQLKEAGVDEVHLQFDGFDDTIYEKIRGQKLLETKLKTLDNLERLNIATDLVVTVVRGVNEKEIIKILDFAVKHQFIKEVFFLGCRFLGRAKNLSLEQCLMPDELIDMIEEQSAAIIARKNILNFQKLYFALLSALSVRKCFYIQHFLIFRDKNTFTTIDRLFNLEYIQSKINRFKELKMKKNKWAAAYLILFLCLQVIRDRSYFLGKELLSFICPFIRGFNLSLLPKKSILLGFISACDTYSFDYDVACNCGKGAISTELGIQDSGAIDNILREKWMKEQ